MREIAVQFGKSLDNDNFDITKRLLSQNCKYIIGDEVLIGPENICQAYEQNMIDGRMKLDILIWGQSSIETINDSQYYVHFADYLTHREKSYTHKCKQKLTINNEGKITLIEHIHDQKEQDRLDNYYKRVGLK